jgi:hypothetical protein
VCCGVPKIANSKLKMQRRSPAGRSTKVDTFEVEEHSHPKVYDARLVAAADNVVLLGAMVFLLVSMGLALANLIALSKPTQCESNVTFLQIFLGASVALVIASVASLFTLLFSYPGSPAMPLKVPSFYVLLVVSILHYVTGGIYGAFVWAGTNVLCSSLTSFTVVIVDVLTSQICVGLPLLVFGFLWYSGSPLVRNIATKFPSKSNIQVNRYVL